MMTLLAAYKPDAPMEGPLVLHVTAYMPVAKSWTKRRREDALAGLTAPTGKPDLDNLVKHVKDCLSQMCFWGDDCQVVHTVSAKRYSDRPRWEIEIRPWVPEGLITAA